MIPLDRNEVYVIEYYLELDYQECGSGRDVYIASAVHEKNLGKNLVKSV